MRWWVCGVVALACGVVTSVGAAQPVLRVRSETRIDLQAHDGQVLGTLVDDASVGVPGKRLSVSFSNGGDRERVVVMTDGEGRFELAPHQPLPLDVEATFDGDEHFQRATAVRRLEVVPTTLRFTSDARSFDLDETTHTLSVELSGPTHEENELVLRNELGHLLGRQPTGTTHRWEIASPELGPVGAGALRVLLQDPAERVLAEAEIRIVRFRQPAIVVERRPTEDTSVLELSARLADSAGPLRRRALSVFLDNERVETVLTGTEGEVDWATDLESGAHTVYLRFESDQVGHPSTESATLEIVTGSAWTAELWFLLPFAAFALFALWLRRSQPTIMSPAPEPVVRGVSLQVPTKATRTREVSGLLKDLVDGSSKPGSVRAVPKDGPPEQFEIADDGRFSFELPPGEWRLVFSSVGHAPEILDLRSPHDGRFLKMNVRLENWRHRAVRVLHRAAKSVLGRRDLTSTTVHQLRSEPYIAEIAADVETIAYGPEASDGAAIGALEEKAARILPTDDRAR